MATVFSVQGELTEAGKTLQAYIDQQLEAAGTDLHKLNRLPGVIRHYFANVKQLKALSPARYFEDYAGQLQTVEDSRLTEAAKLAESQQTADNTAQIGSIEAKLTQFQEAMQAEIDALKKQNAELQARLDAKKPGRKPKTADDVNEPQEDTSEE